MACYRLGSLDVYITKHLGDGGGEMRKKGKRNLGSFAQNSKKPLSNLSKFLRGSEAHQKTLEKGYRREKKRGTQKKSKRRRE